MGNEFFKAIQYGNDTIFSYEFKKRFITSKDIISYEELEVSVKTFIFKNVLFKEDVNLKFIFKTGFNYHFGNCEFESFNCIEIDDISFTIRNSKFTDNFLSFLHTNNIKLTIHNSLTKLDFSILNCEGFKLEMINNVPVDISISDSNLLDFNIGNIHEKKNLTFNSNKSTFTDLQISNFEIIDFIFVSSDFKKLWFNQVKCNNIVYIDIVGKSVSSINISASTFSNLCFSGGYDEYIVDLVEEFVVGKIEDFKIHNSSNVIIRHIDIKNIVVEGEFNNNIKVSFCSVKSFRFENFNCLNPFRIESLKQVELDKFSIIDSNLKNLEIIPSFLHHVNSFAFSNSSIVGIKVIGFEKIPESIIDNSTDMTISQKIDFARELSALMIEQNNNYLTIVYRALEQDLRLRLMPSKFNMDYIVLALNSLSNSHGTRPEKAFILMLLVILIHFLGMRIEFALNADWLHASDFFWINISYYFKPFTFISDINFEYYKFSKGFIFFDFLYKISFGYLLYQFIAAFRKFNK